MQKNLTKKGFAIAIIFLFIGMSTNPSTATVLKKSSILSFDGNTLYVGGDGPGNYSTIQAAIDDASDGDTVFVYNGTYHEAVDVDKSINLIGEDKDITKIINECEDLYAVDIFADFVNISGFTIITNCWSERHNIDNMGLISIGSCNNNVSDNILKGDYGGEIFAGMELSCSSNNNTILGNIILDNDWGIYMSSSSNNIIKNNNLSNNAYDITLEENCMNNTIIGNTLLDTWWCYSIGIHFSSNNTIIDNTFSRVGDCACIELYSSNKNIVMNNTMISVPYNGIGNGISIRYSKENIIIGNTIKNLKFEWQSGISLWSATDNTITSNNLICCSTGISSYEKDFKYCSTFNINTRCKNSYIDKLLKNHCDMEPIYSCNNNTIHHNNFFNNTQNAYDKCSNEWDNGYPSGGNYWDDYTGKDNDGDGIGDTPYNISGGDNQDRYPLMESWGDNLFPITKFSWAPSHPEPEESIFFDASQSNDYDGNIILYEWDWNNDGVFDENHTSPYTTHSWPNAGYYPVTLKVTDNSDLFGMMTKTVRVGNRQPTAPIITGKTNGKIGIVAYQYNFSLFDPDDDSMYLRVDWGNGTPGPWQGSYDSDTTIRLNYMWNETGTFTIRAQAKDTYDAESEWGTLEVTMPRNKVLHNSLFLRLLEQFQNAFPILRYIVNILE